MRPPARWASLAGLTTLVSGAAIYRAAREVPAAMGGKASGLRAQRMESSPHFAEGKFHNQSMNWEPSTRGVASTAKELAFGDQARKPARPVPLVTDALEPQTNGLHVTWFGHSSVLLDLDGARVLLDPVWSDRCSPSQQVGPKRLHPNPIELSELCAQGGIDAVVISHDHYDHLDMASIQFLAKETQAQFVVPLGVGMHLESWGIAADRITDLDWEESTTVAGLTLIACQAQHFSGRGFSRDGTLWAAWAIKGPQHSVFYTGDGGYFVGFGLAGERHGPFDVSLVQIGAYDSGWPTIHMTPEQGVETHIDVRAGLLIPVHWCTFNLAFHPWSEPVERLLSEAERREVKVVVPRPGERVDVSVPPALNHWWRAVAE